MSDDRRVHHIRQSDLSTYTKCPEQLRLRWTTDDRYRMESDAAAVGTAVHAGIEAQIESVYQTGDTLDHGEVFYLMHSTFERISQMPNFEWSKGYERKWWELIQTAYGKWMTHVLPTLQPAGTEIGFKNLVLHEDDERVIYANGTIDYLDAATGLKDWKFPGRPYEPWEYRRWDPQSTMYTWAAVQLGIIEESERYSFEFVVTPHAPGKDRQGNPNPEVQRFTVERTAKDWAWLKRQALQIALQVEANLPMWQLNDASWLCSARWCGAYADCRGKAW